MEIARKLSILADAAKYDASCASSGSAAAISCGFACRLRKSRLIVTLGATAAHSVLGKPTPIQRTRGRLIPVSAQTQVLVTVHPSYLLRVPEQQHSDEYRRFVSDLQIARDFALAEPATPVIGR